MPNLPVMHPMVQNLFRHAEEVGLPVTTDGSDQLTGDFGLYDDPGLPQLEHTLQRFPNLIIPSATAQSSGPRSRVWRRPASGATSSGLAAARWGGFLKGPVKEEGVVPKLMRLYPNLYGDLSDGTAYNAIARDPVWPEVPDGVFRTASSSAPISATPRWRFRSSISDRVARHGQNLRGGLPQGGARERDPPLQPGVTQGSLSAQLRRRLSGRVKPPLQGKPPYPGSSRPAAYWSKREPAEVGGRIEVAPHQAPALAPSSPREAGPPFPFARHREWRAPR